MEPILPVSVLSIAAIVNVILYTMSTVGSKKTYLPGKEEVCLNC